MKPRVESIPYQEDSSRLFSGLLNLPWPIFLDSSLRGENGGRYDILTANPVRTLVCRNGETVISGGGRILRSREDPLQVIQRELAAQMWSADDTLPFSGGALGFFSYDLGRCYHSLESIADDELRLPEMAVGLYDWAIVVDHRERCSYLMSQGGSAALKARLELLKSKYSKAGRAFQVTGDICSNFGWEEYKKAFQRIQRYIREGDCYQVNLAQRFQASCSGDPWKAYCSLRQSNPAPFSAYLDLGDLQLLSCSPERFLQLRGTRVETKPIKGTRPRGNDEIADRLIADELLKSGKDRAENLMIVDLLRNDLGRCCRPGSIEVPKLFHLEQFARVHHLVSTITGELGTGEDAFSLLRACFPGGSITGAPKRRAMQIIEELEPCRRAVYCGSIGYIGCDGNMDSNIAIRTLIHKEGRISLSAGGGLVADSDCAEEYRETWHKASAFLDYLNSRTL